MNLIEPDGSGPQPGRLGANELVACTRLRRPLMLGDDPLDPELPPGPNCARFEAETVRFCAMLSVIGHDTGEAVLQARRYLRGAHCGAADGARCVVFGEFDTHGVAFEIEGLKHGLLLLLNRWLAVLHTVYSILSTCK